MEAFLVVTVLGVGVSWCCWYLVGRAQECGKHSTVRRRGPPQPFSAQNVNSATMEKPISRGIERLKIIETTAITFAPT